MHRDNRSPVIDRIEVVDVGRGQHRDDSGQSFGFGRVARANSRVRVRTAKDFAVKHAGDEDVADEFCFAGYFVDAVDSRNTVPDVFELSLRHAVSESEIIHRP